MLGGRDGIFPAEVGCHRDRRWNRPKRAGGAVERTRLGLGAVRPERCSRRCIACHEAIDRALMLPLNLCLPYRALADLHLSEWFDAASWDRRGWSRKEAEVGRRDRCRRDACIRALVEVGDPHAVGHFDDRHRNMDGWSRPLSRARGLQERHIKSRTGSWTMHASASMVPFSEGRAPRVPPVEPAVLCASRLDLTDRTWKDKIVDKTSRFGIVYAPRRRCPGPPRDARTLRKTTP